ncbi:MAG: NUDIX hydrolase [Opitutaceae bacterium]|jgi:8-oxo-dGTP pyrophosphatase MutT (NUDIX family)
MSDLTHPHGPSRWERGLSRVIHATKILDLCGTFYRHPVRGTQREFVTLNARDWVNVVALTTEARIVLVRQFRFGIDDLSLEVPGGVIEAGEDPVAAGVRELAEETGYVGHSAQLLGSVYPNPAIQNNRCHIVLVESASCRQPLDWDADEELEVSTVMIEEALRLASTGGITHSLSLCALMLFEAKRLRK